MILELRLKNFRQYRDQTIKFQEGLNLITGANNAGKSTIFYALEYVLFGRVGGYKSVAGLIHPKERGLGVELLFADQNGTIHRLQRIHEKPPKSRTKVVGHFTLKVRDNESDDPDAERYLLSTDFKDTEEALSLMLFKVLGITKRLFETAIHTRQGQCAAILAGAPQLDMVLGVTAAIASADQMRAMALEAEKKGAAKPLIIQNVAKLNEQLQTAEKEAKSFEKQLQENEKEQKLIAEALQKSSEIQARIQLKIDALQANQQTQADIQESKNEVARLDQQIEEVTAQLQELSVEGGREKLAQNIAATESKIESSISDLRDQDEKAKRGATATQLTEQIQKIRVADQAIWEFDFSATTREKLQAKVGALTESKKQTELQIQSLSKSLAKPESNGAVAEGDAKLPDGFDSLQELKQETLLEEARNRTKQEHSTETQERLLEQSNTLKESTQELTREKASQEQELANLQASEEKATTFRKSAAAFKWLQTQLRETAAEHFGEKILKLHQQLSGGNELTSVRIDSKNYMMHVKSKGFKTESPAHLFQGGGQCVMLGIAFKLALAQWLGNVSFLLLDEPTDGLDSKHLQTVLEGLAECPATKQILMITHVPWDKNDLPVTHIERTKNVSEVQA